MLHTGSFKKGACQTKFQTFYSIFSNSYCAKWSPSALVAHNQASSGFCELGHWLEKVQTLGDTALESTSETHLWVHTQALPDFQRLLQQHQAYRTLLCFTAPFPTAGTALKLPSCWFHSTDITWKRQTKAVSPRSKSCKKRKQFERV